MLIWPLLISNTSNPSISIFLLHFLYHLDSTSIVLSYGPISRTSQIFTIIILLHAISIYVFLLLILFTIPFANLAMIFLSLTIEGSPCILPFRKDQSHVMHSLIGTLLFQSFGLVQEVLLDIIFLTLQDLRLFKNFEILHKFEINSELFAPKNYTLVYFYLYLFKFLS